MKSEVTAIKHADVRGNELMYLRIKHENGKEVLINIGEKTYKAINELENNAEEQRVFTEKSKNNALDNKKTVR